MVYPTKRTRIEGIAQMTTTIQIERLDIGTQIYITTWAWANMTAPFNDFAIVEDIHFDGHGYALTLDCGDRHYVDAGSSVRFGGVGEPVLRRDEDISADEFEAKAKALNAGALATLEAATASFCDMLVARNAPGAVRQAAE